MPIRVKCANPQCGKPLVIPDSARGKRIKCPSCGTALAVPEAHELAGPTNAHRCPSCRSELPANAVVCVQCGFNLKTGGRGQVSLGVGDEAPRAGSAALSQLRDFMASGGKWLLLAAVSLAVIVYLLLRPGPAEPPQAQKPPESQKPPETQRPPEPAKPPQEPPKKAQPQATPERKKAPTPPPRSEDVDFTPSGPLCKAIARWEKIDEPFVEQYLERLKGIFRGSFRLVEEDKANWKFEVTQPEQPVCPPGYVLANIKGDVRLARPQDPPGGVSGIAPLPTQSLFVPWYYIFPYAKGARVLWQKLTSACFEFPREGGKVSFGGQELEVPAGAVPEGTRVTLHYPCEDSKNTRAARNLLHCARVEVEPSSAVFSKPLVLRLVSGRLAGASRVFHAHVARRGAKLSGQDGIAAVLPHGRLVWAPTWFAAAHSEGIFTNLRWSRGSERNDEVYAWETSYGMACYEKPDPGWREVPLEKILTGGGADKIGWVPGVKYADGIDRVERSKAARARRVDWENEIKGCVGHGRRLVVNAVGRGVRVHVPGPELGDSLKALVEDNTEVAVRIMTSTRSGQANDRSVELRTALAESDTCGDLLDVEPRSTPSYRAELIRGPRHYFREIQSLCALPPSITALLACRPPMGVKGATVEVIALAPKMPLECLVYRLGEARFATTVCFTVAEPGVYSVTYEVGAPQAAKEK